MSTKIEIPSGASGFAEDKDEARLLRTSKILPSLERKNHVELDFSNIRYATQSYIHALIGEALQKFGESALELIVFKNCTDSVRSVIELVVDYSLGGFPDGKAGRVAS
ncbi:MAG TPA: STAS-like domain-containing protein [Thermoanaerobaculia bacterium]|jgi:hypothetical protein|nr:STAS-like domain-containing protein [Thermoanaerobaculia bacterium]